MSLEKSGIGLFCLEGGGLELEMRIHSVIEPPDKKQKAMCALTNHLLIAHLSTLSCLRSSAECSPFTVIIFLLNALLSCKCFSFPKPCSPRLRKDWISGHSLLEKCWCDSSGDLEPSCATPSPPCKCLRPDESENAKWINTFGE